MKKFLLTLSVIIATTFSSMAQNRAMEIVREINNPNPTKYS